MNRYEINQYADAKCHFHQSAPLPFIAVHQATAGRVCDTGCAWYDNGKCASYRGLTHVAKVVAVPSETVRDEAARRGLSISEVRRQRRTP